MLSHSFFFASKEVKNQRNYRRYTESKISNISDDVMGAKILTLLDNSSLAALASVSFHAGRLAQFELDQRTQPHLRTLFLHILNGDAPDKVKEILDVNRRLPLVRWHAKKEEELIIRNKAGQRIFVQWKTGYQVAIGEDDAEIIAIFRDAIVKVADKKEADRQKKAQLPDEWEKAEEKRWAPVYAEAAFQSVRTAKPGDVESSPEYKLTVKKGSNIDQALGRLVLSCEAILKEPVTTGRHFNSNLMEWVFLTYHNHQVTLVTHFEKVWEDPRGLVCWQRIVGQIQCLFPANYTQAGCDDFWTTKQKLEKGAPQARSFELEVFDHSRREWVWVDVTMRGALLGVDFAMCDRSGRSHMHLPQSSREVCRSKLMIGALGEHYIFANLMSAKKTASERTDAAARRPSR